MTNFLEDSPLNPNKDMSDYAVLRRYDKANLMSIVTSSRVVFEALADIPKLLDERKKLLTKLSEFETIASGGSNNDPSSSSTGSSDAKA